MRAKGLVIGYKNEPLMGPVDIDLNPGKINFLIGRNGMGKSTLFKTLAAQIPSIAGEVIIGTERLSGFASHEWARRVAYHQGRNAIHARMSLSEFLTLAKPITYFKSQGDADFASSMMQVASELRLSDMLDQDVMTLSDGQLQKAMIAQLILRKSEVLLLDEPLSHLDPPTRVEVMGVLRKIAEKHIVFMSTHHLDVINLKEDSILLLGKNGLQTPDKQGLSSVEALLSLF